MHVSLVWYCAGMPSFKMTHQLRPTPSRILKNLALTDGLRSPALSRKPHRLCYCPQPNPS